MNVKTIDEHYMKHIKTFATLSGVWPYQSNITKYTIRVLTYAVVIGSLVSQMARVICFFSLDVLIEQCSFFGAAIGILVKQGNYIINAAQYTALINGIRNDWLCERPVDELDIMHTYAERGVFFTTSYLMCCILCFLLFLQMPLTPRVLDIILPQNESRSLAYIYPAYYALDEQKYHVLIVAHMVSAILLVLFVYVSCDTSFMYTVQHACGLLAVSGHRFKTAVGVMSATEKGSSRQHEIYIRVCHSIRGHQDALKYLQSIQDSHDSYLFICVGMVMICFSVTLVKVSNMNVCIELAKDCTFVMIQLVHIFYLALQGQFVIDSHEKLLDSIYDSLWYECDKRTQLLLVLALRSCFAPPRLTAGGLITLNLQTFAEIIKASVSYFTVLQST